jgi:uncharacterized membrane protein
MRDAFGIVLIVVVVLAAIVAIGTLVGSRRAYEQIGRGGLSINEDAPARPRPAASGAVALRERDDEIRQLLTAANHRREARGEAPVDVEAELARLTAPVVDEGLREEVRQLVIARNDRLVARGGEPLDVDAEVERQLRELGA